MSALVLIVAGAVAASLSFVTPEGWRSSPPGSSMRVAEFVLPRASGDLEDAQLVLYYFGGQGGSVEANIQRWVGQMQGPDGTLSAPAVRKEARHVNGLTLTLVDVSGTYVAETAPGASDHHHQPNFRLRAGVVETSNGPYFIKLTGPARTVARWEHAFDQFVNSFKLQ